MEKKTVLFVCSFNSVRSQIAEGLLNARCNTRYLAYSAGVAPAGLNPYAVSVMREIGIDISSQRSKKLEIFHGVHFDYVITMCDGVKQAVTGSIPEGATILHRTFVSPSETRKDKAEILADFRKLRDKINDWLGEIFPDCPDALQE
ncbi:arsenate reductase ArsC [Methanoregula sp.]|uniref:arsenate reductase ArsC n=1 Tax=Methanoregula sp. TaxID=2052170 RepID=UPI0035695FC1